MSEESQKEAPKVEAPIALAPKSLTFPAIVLGIFILVASVGPGLFNEEMTREHQTACWTGVAADEINGLATQIAAPQFKNSIPGDFSPTDKDKIGGSFHATLTDYFFMSASPDWGTVKCGAIGYFVYQDVSGNAQTVNNGSIVTFTLHPSSSGYGAQMNTLDVEGLGAAYRMN